MALTTTEIETRLDTLRLALVRDTLRVRFDNAEVEYKSSDEVRRDVAYYESLLAATAAAASDKPRRLILSPSSGVEC